MKPLRVLAIPLLILLGSGYLRVASARDKVVYVPRHCIVVDRFDQPCRPEKDGGYVCNRVHLVVRPDPECNQWNTRQVLNVGKPK